MLRLVGAALTLSSCIVQVPAACEAFTFNNRHNILRSMELRRIFTMHLIGLYEFGLLSPNDINKCLRLLEL